MGGVAADDGRASTGAVKILLVDNGSLEPAATLGLRELARRLAERVGQPVFPGSLLHSHKIPAAQLNGTPAVIVEEFLRAQLAAGESDFLILPMFFGPSRAISEYLPGLVTKLSESQPNLRVRIAPVLHRAGETTLAKMLADRVRAELTQDFIGTEPVRVAMVDHGSPVPAVAEVRDEIAAQLAQELGDTVAAVAPCSMERRPGAAYDFNEPLLESLLAQAPFNGGPVIVAQLFLQPGRHAGPEGDIAEICARAVTAAPALRIRRTEPLGLHLGMIELLEQRLADVIAAD